MKKTNIVACLLACAPTGSPADGFRSLEQNASGLGVAYAGSAAVADNASTLHYNPAGMTLLPERQISLGLAGTRHEYAFDDRGSTTTGRDGGDAGHWRMQPNAYLSWAVHPDWVTGLGISSPFSFHTDYDNDWRGRQFALETRLRAWNLNPSVAYKLSGQISLGFGIDYQKLKLEANWADQHRSDTDAAWGWNAGVLFALSPAMRVGVAYRSAMTFDLDPAFPLQGIDHDGKLKTPGVFTVSVWQQITDRWEAMGDISHTRWKTVDGYSENGWRFAWGAAYTHNPGWKTKFGIAYEHGPLRHDRTVALPDHHRLWLSLGGQYRLAKGALDFGYAYQWVKTPDVDQSQDNGLRLRGDYDASGHVLGVQYTLDF
ncbi:MAG: OmpP1/FadL family transporter [Zoogloeaceae bacterium]|jgi:long-chain fatty acid transport protein|nr:OmpP1/FadL family transporter [Zoogloeaceae bacterium]